MVLTVSRIDSGDHPRMTYTIFQATITLAYVVHGEHYALLTEVVCIAHTRVHALPYRRADKPEQRREISALSTYQPSENGCGTRLPR